jgi:hypothetical protein
VLWASADNRIMQTGVISEHVQGNLL